MSWCVRFAQTRYRADTRDLLHRALSRTGSAGARPGLRGLQRNHQARRTTSDLGRRGRCSRRGRIPNSSPQAGPVRSRAPAPVDQQTVGKGRRLRASNERLSALIDLNLQLGSELDLHRLLQGFGRAAREIIGARYAVTGILDEDGTRFRSLFTNGMDAETAAQPRLARSAEPIF